MKKQFLWAALAIAVSAATPLVTTQSADSAIPPLSSQQLRERSTHPVIGKAVSIHTKEVAVESGTDYQHTANLDSRVNPLREDLLGFHPEKTRSFITQIRTAATRRDAKTLVSLVRFPLTLYEMGRPLITYHQPEALMRDFSLVFTDPILRALQQASETKLFINGNGAMIGDGAVWFDEREDGIRIKALNGDREPLKARF